jgi:hypothetical protein
MKRTLLAVAAFLPLFAGAARAPAGTFEVGSGATLDLSTGSLALGCADLDVIGTLTAGTVGFTGGRDVTITPTGVVNGNSATLELSGDWDNTGSFAAGTSTVRIVDGCGLLSGVVNGNSSFHNLELASASGKQVSFAAGATQTVLGLFEVSGVSGYLLKIRSTVDGIVAFLNALGTSTTTFVDVKDNDALAGNDIGVLANSVKGPNTPGWVLIEAIPLLPQLAAVALTLGLLVFARRGLPRWRAGMSNR